MTYSQNILSSARMRNAAVCERSVSGYLADHSRHMLFLRLGTIVCLFVFLRDPSSFFVLWQSVLHQTGAFVVTSTDISALTEIA